MEKNLSFFERLKNKLTVRAENNPGAFMFLLIIAVNILFIALSTLLLMLLPENQGRGIGEMIRFAFTLMVNPSGRYQYSDYPISLIITTVVVLLGMISLTGGTVGFVTSIITGVLERSAATRRHLRLKKHIVILNYNHKVPSIIYDYCFDDMDNTFVVILSDQDKKKIRKQIDNLFSVHHAGKKFRNIIIQNGSPFSKLDLDRIALKDARTVLLMTEGGEQTEITKNDERAQNFNVFKLFIFINSYLNKNKSDALPCILAEVSDGKTEKLIRDYPFKAGDNCFPVNFNELLGKIMAITAVMPSLCDTILHLISFEGVEFYLSDIPQGVSITDDIRRQSSAMPVLDTGSKRLYISESEDLICSSTSGSYKLQKPLPAEKLVPCILNDKPKILIIGCNNKLRYILESLVCFRNEYPAFQLSVVLMDTAENAEKIRAYCNAPEYSVLFSDETKEPVIVEDIFEPFGPKNGAFSLDDINSVLFLSDDDCSDTNVDEKPLLFWNSLKCCDQLDKHNCIVEVLDMQNENIIEKQNNDQVVVSERFVSCLYAQLGKDPIRLDFIKDMITFENDEASRNSKNKLSNACNILSVRADLFFRNCQESLRFSSKRELILWVFEATGHAYLPIGCVKNNVSYLFSRTEGKNDGLDTAVLLPKNDNSDLRIDRNELTLEPNDEIIVIMRV
ncbi:MAG TPA: hypothetical protein DCG49_08095 [Ruminococcus sp.]|nr:hypothetical protein [Ruminococcus sp.]